MIEEDPQLNVEEIAAPVTVVQENDHFFEELVDRYHAQVYNIAYRMAGNAADAEDLTQDAFIKAFRSFGRFRRDLPFVNWIYPIVRNLYIDSLRRKPKHPNLPLQEEKDDGVHTYEIPDWDADPARKTLSAEFEEKLQEALLKISPDFRMAVVLCDIEGMSYEEIAEAMKCSPGTVRSRIHRGRRLLREYLRDYVYLYQ